MALITYCPGGRAPTIINQSIPQPPRAYCETHGDIVVRIGKNRERWSLCVPVVAFKRATGSPPGTVRGRPPNCTPLINHQVWSGTLALLEGPSRLSPSLSPHHSWPMGILNFEKKEVHREVTAEVLMYSSLGSSSFNNLAKY